MNIYKISITSLALSALFVLAVTMPAYADSFDSGYTTGGYDGGGYTTGGYDGGGYTTGGYDGYTTGSYDGGYTTGGYDGYTTGGYDGGYTTGGYDSGYLSGGYDGGYTTGGYDSGYLSGGYDSGYLSGGYDGGYTTGGYDALSGGTTSYNTTPVYGYQTYTTGCSTCSNPVSVGGIPVGHTSTPSYTYSFGTPTSNTTFVTPSYNYSSSNTCTGNSCNTSVTKNTTNYTDNSINNSFNTTTTDSYNTVDSYNTNVTTVKSVPSTPTYAVQYTYPVYTPTYYQPTYSYQAPSCSISISGGYQGGTATLTWSISGYVTSAYITPSVGYVSAQQGTQSRTIYNTASVYTMAVVGPGGSNTCQTHYYQPYIPQTSVSLSQIPYTGFDFGAMGDTLYWLSLLSFALAGAYLLVYYRGGAFQLAGALIEKRNPQAAAAIEAPVQAMKKAVAPIAERLDRLAESFDLPVATDRRPTTDTMAVAHGKEGDAPRIVITRS